MVGRVSPILRISDLHKNFGSLEVLKGISLQVMPSEVVSIIGASGSGKSTFLRCVNMMEMPDRGTMEFEILPFPLPPRRRRASACHPVGGAGKDRHGVSELQSVAPYDRPRECHRSADAGAPSFAARSVMEADDLLQRIGLIEKRNVYPGKLSGGQQQRVAIVRALAMRPRVMLFDEVTSALDPELVGEVLALMAKLAADGMTMLLVTHEIAFARDVSSRTIFFDRGIIAEDGSPDQVLREPKSERLRQFLKRILHEDIGKSVNADGHLIDNGRN